MFISSLRGFRTFSHPWVVAPRIPVVAGVTRYELVRASANVSCAKRVAVRLIATTNSGARGIRRVSRILTRILGAVFVPGVRSTKCDRSRRAVVVPRCRPRRSLSLLQSPRDSPSLCLCLALSFSLPRRSVLDRSGAPIAPAEVAVFSSLVSSHHPLQGPSLRKDASA